MIRDPAVVESYPWSSSPGSDFSGWYSGVSNEPNGFGYTLGDNFNGRGLYIYQKTNPYYFPAKPQFGDFGQWHFQAPGTSFIYGVQYGAFAYYPSPEYRPYTADECLKFGIWSNTRNAWDGEGSIRCGPLSSSTTYHQSCTRSDCGPSGTPGNYAIFASYIHRAGTRTGFVGYLGAASIYLSDSDVPEPMASSIPSGWSHGQGSVGITTRDTGLGVKRVNAYSSSSSAFGGSYTSPCSGDRHYRCPNTVVRSYSMAGLPEGTSTVRADAEDIIGNSGSNSWPLKGDRTAPNADLGGSLYAARGSFVAGDSHTLAVSANDPHSGVKGIDYKIKHAASGTVVRSGAQANSCSSNDCPTSFNNSFAVDLTGLDSARYVVEVTTKDQLGDDAIYGSQHRRVQSFEVEIDRTAPQVTSVTSAPDRWLKDGDQASTTVGATDADSGVKSFELAFPSGEAGTITRDCGGLDEPGRCAAQDEATFDYPIGPDRCPDEGRTTVSGTATDAVGHVSEPETGEVRVDRSPPELELGGTLSLARDTLLVLPSHDLTYEARDGSTASPEEERSGARQVRVLVRKDAEGEEFVEKHSSPVQDCPQGSCSLDGSWTFEKGEYESNTRYIVRVVATDQLGHETVEEFSVYVAGFDVGELPQIEDRTGLEDWWHYESVETGAGTRAHVNLATGNLVWHATPVVNPGRGLQTFANLTYNSQESQEDALRPETPAGDLLGQYNEVGRGFSLGISGVTRLNEPLDLSKLALGEVALTDADGTPHVFEAEGEPTDPGYGEAFESPAGVQLHLRRFEEPDPLGGPQARAWAMTRPDGVTYFFDELGYQTFIRDRNANEMRFVYEYRSPTKAICESADQLLVPPEKACVRKVVAVVDATGRELSLTYKQRTADELAAGVLPDGSGSVTLESPEQASGQVAQIVDHADRSYTFEYEGTTGYLERFTEAAGAQDARSWEFDYEAGDLLKRRALVSVSDPRSASTTFAHRSDDAGGLLGETGDGITHRRRVAAVTDRGEQGSGRASRDFTYAQPDDASPVVDRATVLDARDNEWRHDMDAVGRPLALVDPLGTETRIVWDEAPSPPDNNATTVVQAAGSADEATTGMSYNELGQLLSSTDPEGRTTTFSYRPGTGVAANRAPSDGMRGFVSDVLSITSPRGNATAFAYDGDTGNVISTTDGEGFTATTDYDAFGQIESETDEVGNTTRFEDYDPSGLPRRMVDPRAKVWTYAYDAVGNVLSAGDPRADGGCGGNAFTTRLDYDSFDRVVGEVSPKDSQECVFVTRTSGYDSNGNLEREVDANGEVWERDYSPMDELTEERSPVTDHADGATASEVARRDYDREGNLVLEVSPKGTAAGAGFETAFQIDQIGRTLAETRRSAGAEPDALTTSFAYDRRDNMVALVDPEGNESGDPVANAADPAKRRFVYEYDLANNRTVAVEDPAGESLRTETAYDDNDNRVSEVGPRGFEPGGSPGEFTKRWEYDDRDLLTGEIDQTGARTHYDLRGDGKVVGEVSPRGTAAGGDGSEVFRTGYGYYPTGELRELTLPRAPGQYEPASPTVDYTINAVGDPIAITDARNNRFENTFFDGGELRSTGRPSWWLWAREPQRGSGQDAPAPPGPPSEGEPEVRERSPQEMWADLGQPGPLPESEGYGDFGEVDPEAPAGILPRAGQTTLAYDSEMRLTGVTDVAGNETQVSHDALGRVTQTRQPFDPAGDRSVTHRYGFDRNGNLARATQTEAFQRTDGGYGDVVTDYGYDQFDRLATVDAPGTDATGRELTRLTYDRNDNLTERQTPRGPGFTWRMDYDSVDRLEATTNPAGETERAGYDAAGNQVSMTTPRGKVWEREYTRRDQLAAVIDPDNERAAFDYDANGNQTRVEAPGARAAEGAELQRRVTVRTFDGRDLPWSETVGSGEHARTTVTEFDPNGNLRREVNPAGVNQETKLPRNTYGGGPVSRTSTAAENATVREYNDDNVVTAVHLPFGDVDGAGPAPTDPDRWRMDFAPNARGWVEAIDSPYEWDEDCGPGAPPSDTGCTSRTRYGHFANGWVSSQTDPIVVDPDGGADFERALSFDYDPRGNQTLWRSPLGQQDRRVVRRQLHPNGTLASRTAEDFGGQGPGQRSYRYAYNPNRSMTQMVDEQKDRTTQISYDGAERPVLVDETWDEDGDLLGRRSRDTLSVYDRDGSVVDRLTDGQASGTDPASYEGGKTTSFAFDDLGRETAMFVCDGGPVQCTNQTADRETTTAYFPSSHTRSRTKPNGVVERFFFDNDGRAAQMIRAKNGNEFKDRSYSYDPNGNRVTDERGSHLFNPRDQLVEWTRGAQNATQDRPAGSTVDYTLNGAGAILEKVDSAGDRTETFDYNGDRLVRATASEPGALSAFSTYCYSGDGFGEVEEIRQASEPSQPAKCSDQRSVGETENDVTYAYDDFARMVSSKGPGEDDDTTYSYDGVDRRDLKTEPGPLGVADEVFEYAYVGLSERLSREEDSGRVRAKSYDYDSQMRRLGQETTAIGQLPKFRSYAFDANGSVEGLEHDDGTFTETGQANADRYRYDPYGELDTDSPDAEDDLGMDARENPFRFEGFYYDAAIKTYDMQARPYRPDMGRFLTQDRFQSASGDYNLQSDPLTNNRYAFAGGNPVNNIEYDGHEPVNGSFKNNPDRNNDYGGRSGRNVNRHYNYAATPDGNWQINTTSRLSGATSSRTVPIPVAAAPAPVATAAAPAQAAPGVPNGITVGDWRQIEQRALAAVSPGGVGETLFGSPYSGLRLNNDGQLEFIENQQLGLGRLARLAGLGKAASSAGTAARRAASSLPAGVRERIAKTPYGQKLLGSSAAQTTARSIDDLPSLRGATPSEVDDLARKGGFEVFPGQVSKVNPATRYYRPGTSRSEGFRVLPEGVRGQPGIKSGPYLKRFGPKVDAPDSIPLRGNPEL